MKFNIFNRLFFIKVLGAIAVVLIAVLGYMSYHKKVMIEERNMRATKDSIEVKFVNTVKGMGIKKEWIQKKLMRPQSIAGIDSAYYINVPSDLPIGVILAELNKQFIQDTIILNAAEKEIRGSTDLLISADKQHKLFAKFICNKTFARSTAQAAFVLTGLDEEDEAEQNRIIQLPEELSFIFIPSKANIELVKNIRQNRKEYAILLNDDIKETNYKLDKKYNKFRLVNSIKDIIAGFKDAKYFVVDNNSGLMTPETYKIIEEEFLKRNIKIVKLNEFQKIEGSGEEELRNKFRTELNSISPDKIELYLMSISDFNSVSSIFQELRKKGLKYVSLSETGLTD